MKLNPLKSYLNTPFPRNKTHGNNDMGFMRITWSLDEEGNGDVSTFFNSFTQVSKVNLAL